MVPYKDNNRERLALLDAADGSSRWVSRRRPMTCSGTTFGIDVTYTLTAP
jgi:hypothetical protein